MVATVRSGEAQRSVARRYKVALSTVQFWCQRADGLALERVDWSTHASGPHQPANRTPRPLEDLVLQVRRELREQSDLGEYGAEAIHRELTTRGTLDLPTARTLHRILERRGGLDGHRRIRRPPPPRGWYLPDVADARAELDQFDMVEGLVIANGPQVEVLTGVSLHGGLVLACPTTGITAKIVRESLLVHWREFGLPAYAQFDNATVFQGPHQHPDAIGSVIRLCLSLGVTPVFAPPRETGFQAANESFNGRWQAKVWMRFHHASLDALCTQSAKYVAAYRQRTVTRRDAAPERRAFPKDWTLNLQAQPHGTLMFLRRTTDQGHVSFLGRTFAVDPHWAHRLVRCEVALDEQVIRFYALRRRTPAQQPLLAQVPYTLPNHHFRE